MQIATGTEVKLTALARQFEEANLSNEIINNCILNFNRANTAIKEDIFHEKKVFKS